MLNTSYQALSVRLPIDLHTRSVIIASKAGESLNVIIQRALDRYVVEQEERLLFDAFTELGSDSEMTDIGFAQEAQSEVALRD